MKAVIQRVRCASVEVEGKPFSEIGRGLLILLGVGAGDQPGDAAYLAEKIAGLRIFEDDAGKMNRSLSDAGGSALVVSQFTLYGDCRKGRRPSFTDAAPPERGSEIYGAFVSELTVLGVPVRTGSFGAKMLVRIENDGPMTLIVESRPSPIAAPREYTAG
ncbi:MAG: D-aminoacyl-tRNA deacylase [Candidatus Aureabacteria bacterium]|nr:D-aminoacyl-tRNA deacylase [Candidatus Auribacterota bacterium]